MSTRLPGEIIPLSHADKSSPALKGVPREGKHARGWINLILSRFFWKPIKKTKFTSLKRNGQMANNESHHRDNIFYRQTG